MPEPRRAYPSPVRVAAAGAVVVLAGVVIGIAATAALGWLVILVGLSSVVFFGIVAPRVDRRRGLRGVRAEGVVRPG